MKKFRFLTAGESHGKGLTAIIEGIPAGFEVDIDFINSELSRRQQGYGRGDRMKIETDTVEILSGVRFGKTLGSPVTLFIKNKDYENWNLESGERAFTAYRPGHADYAGSVKYGHEDLRNVLERSSARKTAIEVAVGAIAKLILKQFGIEGRSNIIQIGESPLYKGGQGGLNEIDAAKAAGDTIGGKFEVIYDGLPVGLGSYVHWDRAIDGKLAQAMMSIPAIKAVEIGTNPLGMKGSEYHDEIFLSENQLSTGIVHKTNNAGGVEGGMTNGEPLVVRAVMKPIPTMKKPLKTVDSAVMQAAEAHFERSDTCAVEAAAVVGEARVACVLVDEFLLKYGGDSLKEIEKFVNGEL
ncbi:MAG: chorismate synthase [Heliobacteriaceae bacterium]|jgi:chorismate synthase|nr:chorismate synthase [Heliobacteriaceae bacterium]